MGIFDVAREKGHEQVVFNFDKETGLKAIIAIHDTTLGPALGGCRFWDYGDEDEALHDVLRLSRGMTYKAAVAGLNLGGGKAVIIGDAKKLKNEALLRSFGRFVNTLNGRYITAEDMNINVRDIDYVAMETRYVTGRAGGSGDPSPVTAWGVFSGIRASVQYKLKRESLKGLKVAVQGAGAVGYFLCKYLHKEGAELFITDIFREKTGKIEKEFNAKFVDPKEIHALDVDVFAPCAMGAVLNDETIPQIKAPIVAGGANNQLQSESKHGEMVRAKGILYAPDYVINAGGLINVYHEMKGYNADRAMEQATNIYDTLLDVFAESDRQNIPTQKASDTIAERRIKSMKMMASLKNNYNNQSWIEGN